MSPCLFFPQTLSRIVYCAKMNRKAETNAMRDNFAGFSEHQLQRMMRSSPWFNDRLISNEELDEMELRLLEKTEKPIRFHGGGDGDDDGQRRDLSGDATAQINVDLLCKEILVIDAKRGGGAGRSLLLLHGITRNGTEHKRLCQWSKSNEVIEPFIQPIQYQIYSAVTTTTTTKTLPRHSNIDKQTALQNRIILSHSDPAQAQLRLCQFIEEMEQQLYDAFLSRVWIHAHIIVLLFEWLEAAPFCFLMAFRLLLPAECYPRARPSSRHHQHQAEEAEESVAEFLATRVIPLGRDEVLRFYDQTTENDSQQKQHGRRRDQIDDIENLILDEAQLDQLKRSLRESRLSYITAGYAKRD